MRHKCFFVVMLLVLFFSEVGSANAFISVKDYGALPSASGLVNRNALNNAIAAVAATKGGTVFIPAGVYNVDGEVLLQSGVKLLGASMTSTVLRQSSVVTSSKGLLYAESNPGGPVIAGISISDISLDGRVLELGFSEFQHLLSLNGVSDVVIERVRFSGFRGDGLYIGNGYLGTAILHNTNIVVRSSVFDGVNNDNRNAISIIDGDSILIDGNYFKNSSRPSMPGAIDVEPDKAFNVIRNIKLVNNSFSANGGSNGSISFYFLNLPYSKGPSNIYIENNDIESSGSAQDQGIFLAHVGDASVSRNHSIVVKGNRLTNTVSGLRAFGINGLLFDGNTVYGTKAPPLLGLHQAGYKNISVKLVNNIFSELDSTQGNGLSIFSVDDLLISGNSFIDCGAANGAFGYSIDFNSGVSNSVRVLDNYFSSPKGRTKWAIQKEANHTFTPNNNRFRDNINLVGGNAFQYIND